MRRHPVTLALILVATLGLPLAPAAADSRPLSRPDQLEVSHVNSTRISASTTRSSSSAW
jgi:hypothetical protein